MGSVGARLSWLHMNWLLSTPSEMRTMQPARVLSARSSRSCKHGYIKSYKTMKRGKYFVAKKSLTKLQSDNNRNSE